MHWFNFRTSLENFYQENIYLNINNFVYIELKLFLPTKHI